MPLTPLPVGGRNPPWPRLPMRLSGLGERLVAAGPRPRPRFCGVASCEGCLECEYRCSCTAACATAAAAIAAAVVGMAPMEAAGLCAMAAETAARAPPGLACIGCTD